MADRYPLIFDSSNNSFKELPSGDNLNLSSNGIVGVSSIGCSGTITGKARFSVYGNNIISSTPITLSSSDVNQVLLVRTDVERTINLPAGSSVSIGDWVKIVDIGSGVSNTGNSYKKNITIDPNGSDKIQGGSDGDTFIMDVDGQAVTLMWCGSEYDWRIIN